MPERGEALVRAMSLDPRTLLRSSVRQLEKHATADSKRLVAKLDKLDVGDLMRKAEYFIRDEGTLIGYDEVNVKAVKADLDALLDIQVRKEDILSWVRDFRQDLESAYTFNRLDWLWDFSWSYNLWGPKYFKPKHILVYGAIRGHKPERMGGVPFQAALNRVRKDIIRRRERSIFRAAKKGDCESLVALGLTPEQAQGAIRMVFQASVLLAHNNSPLRHPCV